MTTEAMVIEKRAAAGSLPEVEPPVGGKNYPVKSSDNGINSCYLDRPKFEQIFSIATMFSKSELVPKHLQGKPADCFILCQLAFRMNCDPFMVMQNCYVVYGRPGFEAKFAIALINSSGRFEDPLEFEFNDAKRCQKGWTVTASAKRRHTGQICKLEFDWETAEHEGWTTKKDSKWKTMPDQMMRYRAATFFARVFCPEVLMGMPTVDELEDVGQVREVENLALQPGTHNFGFQNRSIEGPASTDAEAEAEAASESESDSSAGAGGTEADASSPPATVFDAVLAHAQAEAGPGAPPEAVERAVRQWAEANSIDLESTGKLSITDAAGKAKMVNWKSAANRAVDESVD